MMAELTFFKVCERLPLEYLTLLFTNKYSIDKLRVDVRRSITRRLLGCDPTSDYIARCKDFSLESL